MSQLLLGQLGQRSEQGLQTLPGLMLQRIDKRRQSGPLMQVKVRQVDEHVGIAQRPRDAEGSPDPVLLHFAEDGLSGQPAEQVKQRGGAQLDARLELRAVAGNPAQASSRVVRVAQEDLLP